VLEGLQAVATLAPVIKSGLILDDDYGFTENSESRTPPRFRGTALISRDGDTVEETPKLPQRG
jgi:hypothetical protein